MQEEMPWWVYNLEALPSQQAGLVGEDLLQVVTIYRFHLIVHMKTPKLLNEVNFPT